MPVFINEVVFRGDVQRAGESRDSAPGATAVLDPGARQQLIDEVTQTVLDYLERELDRIGER